MKKNYSFPHFFKMIGWLLFVPALLLGITVVFFDFEFEFLNGKALALFYRDGGMSNTSSIHLFQV